LMTSNDVIMIPVSILPSRFASISVIRELVNLFDWMRRVDGGSRIRKIREWKSCRSQFLLAGNKLPNRMQLLHRNRTRGGMCVCMRRDGDKIIHGSEISHTRSRVR
jgi:hypothetical protein